MSSYARPRHREPLSHRLHLVDTYGLTIGGFLLTLLAVLVAFVSLLMFGIIQFSRAVGRTTCRNFAAQTGYPTKFVLLNFFDGGTCLAQAPNGRWVLNTRVLTFTGRKP